MGLENVDPIYWPLHTTLHRAVPLSSTCTVQMRATNQKTCCRKWDANAQPSEWVEFWGEWMRWAFFIGTTYAMRWSFFYSCDLRNEVIILLFMQRIRNEVFIPLFMRRTQWGVHSFIHATYAMRCLFLYSCDVRNEVFIPLFMRRTQWGAHSSTRGLQVEFLKFIIHS